MLGVRTVTIRLLEIHKLVLHLKASNTMLIVARTGVEPVLPITGSVEQPPKQL